MKVNKRFPVTFEQVESLDNRFTKVKIWLMHTGLNYNRSIFEKEIVEKAFPTLKNTPILAYIEESIYGENDFAGHEMELVIQDGEYKTRYLGKAVGVIPEDCNPRWEYKEGDNGQLLEYLVVDGIMWNKFDEAVGIIKKRGEVAQSMEIDDKYDGYWDEEGNFKFTDFSFYGACLLGQDVLPAMQRASVELYSFDDKVFKTVQEKMNEYKKLFSLGEVNELNLKELLAKYSTTIDELGKKGIDVNTFTVEELEIKLQEVFSGEGANDEESKGNVVEEPSTQMSEGRNADEGDDQQTSDNVGEEFSTSDNNEDQSTSDKFAINFELSHDDIRRSLYQNLDQHIFNTTGVEGWHYIVSVFDSYFIVEDEDGQKFHKIEYTKEGDVVSLGSVVEVYSMFLTADEKGALDLMRSTYDQLKQENFELNKFKAQVHRKEHEALAEDLFSKFSKLTDDDIADLRENVHDYTIEQLESKLYEKLGRKTATISTKAPQSYSMKININNDRSTDYSGYARYFKKHGLV